MKHGGSLLLQGLLWVLRGTVGHLFQLHSDSGASRVRSPLYMVRRGGQTPLAAVCGRVGLVLTFISQEVLWGSTESAKRKEWSRATNLLLGMKIQRVY